MYLFEAYLSRIIDMNMDEFNKNFSKVRFIEDLMNIEGYHYIYEEDYNNLTDNHPIKQKAKKIKVEISSRGFGFYQVYRNIYVFKEETIFYEDNISYTKINECLNNYKNFNDNFFISFNFLRELVLKNLLSIDFLDKWEAGMYIYIKKSLSI